MLNSPLRYPGGKAKVLDAIFERFPTDFLEFREPFVGGGSVFLTVRQKFPEINVWINDLNLDLIAFWRTVQTDCAALTTEVRRIKETEHDGRALFERFRSSLSDDLTQFERAVRFFVLNRISFSGTVDSGGYSEQSFQGRFTHSSIDRVQEIAGLMQGVRITHLDYREVIDAVGTDVFVFLDPPYFSATKSKLYGKKGDLHVGFDHAEFALEMQQCLHRWLITYDDCSEIRNSFKFAQIEDFSVQYGMNNYRQPNAARGAELFISDQTIVSSQDELFAFV
jgi:DNA adenine methylase